ncbi:MAG: protein TolQ [Bdellovibrionales bacterium]|nr:protein TolQ [Bdellovibrionales bacterium]
MNTPHAAPNGILDLISQSGPVAKLVLLILVFASVVSWAIILFKWRIMKTAAAENVQFLNLFWNGKSIEEIYNKADRYPRSPIANVFRSGVKELRKLTSADGRGLDESGVHNVGRSLSRASASEVASLEKHVAWLATTASASPFIGLFGTVWGIMNSFQGIGSTGSANLAVVAPGISEALITTATGIAAAIPAVIAYNHFGQQIRRVAVDMDCFAQDFLNIVQRSMMGSRKG